MITPEQWNVIGKKANKIYNQLELEIIQEIAERIANVGYANTVVLNDILIAQEMGVMYEHIVQLVAKYNNTSASQIKEIFETAGIKSLDYDDKIYKLAGLEPKPLKQSKGMWQLLSATAMKTHNNLNNLVMTTANTSQTQFYNAMNKAYMEVSTGVKSYSQAIIDTIKEVSQQGAYIEYPSGQHRSIESAVRTNIVTSVNQTCGKLQEMRADEMGWDLVEVTAHFGSRPEHSEWQGKVYSLKGLTKGYKTLEEACGYGSVTGLCGVNCRHNFFPYYKDSTKTYTNKELEEMKNAKVKYNGQIMSRYDAEQLQRKMERQIRQDKKDIAGLQGILTSNSKDDKLIENTKLQLANTQIKLKQHNSILNEFTKQTGLIKDNTRLMVGNNNKNNLDIAEPLNRLIKEQNQKTTKEIVELVDKYDKDKKIKIDYLNDRPFRYSRQQKKVLVNPNHPNFDDYNYREAITHEIVHMIDENNNISKDNQLRVKVEDLKDILVKRKDKLNKILESSDYNDNIFISDLFGGITKNDIRGYWSHPTSYWNNNDDRFSEIVANIETIYLRKDKKGINLINTIPEFKEIYKEVVKKYGEII